MWKITNKFKDIRKFRDGRLGRDVLLRPGESAMTMTPPEQSEVFDVEKVTVKEVKKTKEMTKDDSSSSR